MKIKIEFDFGIGVNSEGEPLDAVDVFYGTRVLEHFVSELAGGCSVFHRTGCWRDGDAIIREPGVTLVTVVSQGTEIIDSVVARIKKLFQQKSVLVTTTPVISLLL